MQHYTYPRGRYLTGRLQSRIMKKKTLSSPLLGGLSAAEFLADYWQKKPLLIRGAVPGFKAFLNASELLGLAAHDDVESRLISFIGQHWEMRPGPFADRAILPLHEKKDWAVQVHDVNLHHDGADALLRQFRFIPDARRADLTAGYAVDGGGTGPHFDADDVFLFQVQGQQRWRIGAQKDLSLVEGTPLQILRNFRPEQEFLLEPGDMLYLPPLYARDGIAVGESIGCALRFRAPSFQELGESFLQFMSDSVELPGRYADPDLAPATKPAELGSAMIEQVAQQIAKIRFTPDDIAIFLGEYLSTPKARMFFDAPQKPLAPKRFMQAAVKHGVKLSRKTQMLYKGKHLFVNGESFATEKEDRAGLCLLANQRYLEGDDVAQVSADVQEALCLWYEDGWLELHL